MAARSLPWRWHRVWAIAAKEIAQLRRDRLTFAMLIAVPVMQLLLFGYAINNDPKRLPTVAYVRDAGPLGRALLSGLANSGYFEVETVVHSPAAAEAAIRSGRAQFVIELPPHFERDVRRGATPRVLVIADASDPSASANAVAALDAIARSALRRELRGFGEAHGTARAAPLEIVVHRLYNPSARTQLNVVPGLLGIVLMMTMMLFTALAVTREIELGTMEGLLAMPIRPVEIMAGKLLPFIAAGVFQAVLIVGAALLLFDVPLAGSPGLLALLTTLFILANLALGYTFSTVARNQLQAVQMTFMFFLPNILLSGFMFPFRGMPAWAQWIGEALPLTHFLRIVRGIMLKGNGLQHMGDDVAALAAFVVLAAALALARFRQTLD